MADLDHDLDDDDDLNNPTLSDLISDLQSLPSSSSSSTPIPDPLLHSLLSLSPRDVTFLFRRVPASSLLPSLTSAIDSPSLLAAKVYLFVLLSPSSPVLSLFTPLAFLSFLRSLRRNVEEVMGMLLEVVAGKVRLDAAHDGRRVLVETMVTVLESTGSSRISDMCFKILYGVVSRAEHGDQVTSTVEVLQNLARLILLPAKSPLKTSVLGFVIGKIVPLGTQNEKVRKALVYLPRFLSVKAPERSEPRAAAVESIVEIVKVMEKEDQVGFVDYVLKMSEGKGNLRLLAVDLFLGLLTSLSDPFEMKEMGMENGECWGVMCLKALLRRCGDSMGLTRARALTNLAQVIGLLTGDSNNYAWLQKIVDSGNVEFKKLLRERCVDEKAAVRKAALLLIMKSISLIGRPLDQVVLTTMASACSDPLVSIRKAALMALSEVLRRFPDDKVISLWLQAVPPLIVDNETSIQEECENLFLELVLDRISRASRVNLGGDSVDLESLIPEGVLDLLKGICDGEVAPCVKKICASLGKKRKLKSSIANALLNIISTSESLWLRSSMPIEKWVAPPGAWQLLAEVSLFTPKAVDWKFLQHHWKLLDKANPEETEANTDGEEASFAWAGDRVFLLQTISNVSIELPPLPASELAEDLLKRVEDFDMNLSEVDAHVKTLKTLCKRKAVSSEEGDTLVLKWVHQLLSKALKILDKGLTDITEASKVSSFMTPPSCRRKGKKALRSKSMLQAVTAVFTIGSLILICPSADMQGIIPLLHTIITSDNSERKPKKLAEFTVPLKGMAPSLYIESWVTMGKICLVDSKLAKRYIPLFVQELEKSDCAALRNNIMVMMADFCVRYTALVDCYISRITTSLRDPCEVVRRQTFILLSRLLQRDYVKWRGVLFLRFLLSLVDESEQIRHLADFLFGNILKIKAPLLAYNSFIEAIFVLNGCNAHSGQTETQGSMQAGARLSFSIRGNDERSRSQRMHIYVSLLKQMAPEHLLATSAKICAEILAAASDGLLSIDDPTAQSVLKDSLQILACKEMRIHQTRNSDTHDMDEESAETGAAALQAARGRVVSHVIKKNLIQNAVPIFIELKRLLESKNSPLIGSLMECLRSLLKDYKSEFEEIFVADKQLQKELMYDMKKYENAKARVTVQEAVASVQKSGGVSRVRSPAAVYAKVAGRLGTEGGIRSAVADAAAEAIVKSVLKEKNLNVGDKATPLGSMSVPKLRTGGEEGGGGISSRFRSDALESVRRRQDFESDDEN